MFKKVLIANRGEIAVRIIKACQELGIATVAVYSSIDRDALHVQAADEAYPLGGVTSVESYLNQETILKIARQSAAEAIHPGYGFLSEKADFASAVDRAGFIFIGPPASAIRVLGNKIAAKKLVQEAGVPIVPGYHGDDQDDEILLAQAEHIGFPVLVKAAAGGGGKGMRIVAGRNDFFVALDGARREAQAAFGESTVFLERYLTGPRHIEIQVLADTHGHSIHLGERECSIQRRHQKILEETPSVALTPELRTRMGLSAVQALRSAGYSNAGTVEFMLDEAANYYFLEVNTRLQVEHPITETVTGLDLVKLQLAIAAGDPLGIAQEEVTFRGHAIECRIYAEDPARGFLPSTGRLVRFDPPHGVGIRNDVGVGPGDEVSIYYDPLLAKLIVAGRDRAEAISRMSWALAQYQVQGVTTNIPFLRDLLADPDFVDGRTTTSFLDGRHYASTRPLGPVPARSKLSPPILLAVAFFVLNRSRQAGSQVGRPGASLWQQAGPWRMGGHYAFRYFCAGQTYAIGITPTLPGVAEPDTYLVQLDGQDLEVRLVEIFPGTILVHQGAGTATVAVSQAGVEEPPGTLLATYQGQTSLLTPCPAPDLDKISQSMTRPGGERLKAPMPGKIIKVAVQEGDQVSPGQPLVVMEAMKMEHTIQASHAAIVRLLPYRAGQLVQAGAVLVELEELNQS